MITTYEALLEALEEEDNQLTLYALGDWEEERGNLVRAEAWRYLGRYERRPTDINLKGIGWFVMMSVRDGPEIGNHTHRFFNENRHWLPSYWGEALNNTSSVRNAYLLAVSEYERYRQ